MASVAPPIAAAATEAKGASSQNITQTVRQALDQILKNPTIFMGNSFINLTTLVNTFIARLEGTGVPPSEPRLLFYKKAQARLLTASTTLQGQWMVLLALADVSDGGVRTLVRYGWKEAFCSVVLRREWPDGALERMCRRKRRRGGGGTGGAGGTAAAEEKSAVRTDALQALAKEYLVLQTKSTLRSRLKRIRQRAVAEGRLPAKTAAERRRDREEASWGVEPDGAAEEGEGKEEEEEEDDVVAREMAASDAILEGTFPALLQMDGMRRHFRALLKYVAQDLSQGTLGSAEAETALLKLLHSALRAPAALSVDPVVFVELENIAVDNLKKFFSKKGVVEGVAADAEAALAADGSSEQSHVAVAAEILNKSGGLVQDLIQSFDVSSSEALRDSSEELLAVLFSELVATYAGPAAAAPASESAAGAGAGAGAMSGPTETDLPSLMMRDAVQAVALAEAAAAMPTAEAAIPKKEGRQRAAVPAAAHTTVRQQDEARLAAALGLPGADEGTV